MKAAALLLLAAVPASASLAGAAEINIAQGGRLARELCAGCHSVERTGASPMAIAPPLRTLVDNYPLDHLMRAFAEGTVTSHPTMPQFRLDSAQLGDLVAYIRSLRAAPR